MRHTIKLLSFGIILSLFFVSINSTSAAEDGNFATIYANKFILNKSNAAIIQKKGSKPVKVDDDLQVTGKSTFKKLIDLRGVIKNKKGDLTIADDMVPNTDNTYTLGSSEKAWSKIYVNEVIGAGLISLAETCTDGQVLKYNATDTKWECGDDNTGGESIEYVAGDNITIVENIISATDTDTNTTYTAGTGLTLTGTEFTNDLGTSIDASEIDTNAVSDDEINFTNVTLTDFTNDAGFGKLAVAETIVANWINTANPWADNEVADDLTITGGTINDTIIGDTTAAPANFSQITLNDKPLVFQGLPQIPTALTSGRLDGATTDVGEYSSITIGMDGLPVISYLDGTNYDLKVYHCYDISCSSGTATTAYSTGTVGFDTSIAIGADGYPIISYYNSTSQSLEFYQCADEACLSGTQRTLDDQIEAVGTETSIALGSDGYPAIAHRNLTNSDLEFYHCTNANCSTGGSQTLVDATNTGDSGLSLAIGIDGYPIISYHNYDSLDLEVYHCTNTSCSSGSTSSLVTTDSVGWYSSLTIGADGLPIISHINLSNNDLMVYHCNDVTCSSGTSTTVDSTSTVHYATAITIGTNGLPMIAYRDTSGGDMKVFHCANIACTSGTSVTAESIDNAGDYAQITIGSDGFPMAIYYDQGNYDLDFVKANSPFFTNYWARK